MASLNKIDPGEPLDKDIYDLSPEEMKNVPSMPASLEEALNCLEEDHAVPAQGRCVHRGTDRDVHRLQAQERSRCGPPAAASVRVRALLRHLDQQCGNHTARDRHVRKVEDRPPAEVDEVEDGAPSESIVEIARGTAQRGADGHTRGGCVEQQPSAGGANNRHDNG